MFIAVVAHKQASPKNAHGRWYLAEYDDFVITVTCEVAHKHGCRRSIVVLGKVNLPCFAGDIVHYEQRGQRIDGLTTDSKFFPATSMELSGGAVLPFLVTVTEPGPIRCNHASSESYTCAGCRFGGQFEQSRLPLYHPSFPAPPRSKGSHCHV